MLNEYAQIAHQKFLAREREKLRADKRLRDAAPDLLAACKSIVGVFEGHDDVPIYVSKARAAIAKAEGTS